MVGAGRWRASVSQPFLQSPQPGGISRIGDHHQLRGYVAAPHDAQPFLHILFMMQVPMLGCDRGEARRFQHCDDRLRRPKVLQIDRVSFREIFIIEPIGRFLRTEGQNHQVAAGAKDAKNRMQHRRLVLHMMQCVLAGYEIEALPRKRQHSAVPPHPDDVRGFALRLPQHPQ
jgi:hypothetical protein